MQKLFSKILILLVVVLSLIVPGLPEKTLSAASEPGEMRDMTASEIVMDMKVGWNLGNTLDSHGGYSDRSDYQLIAFYMDGRNYIWNMSDPVYFTWTGDRTLTAELSWDMAKIQSEGSSRPATIGLQLWNFSGKVSPGATVKMDVKKAEAAIHGKTYAFPGLLGTHEIAMDKDGKVGSLETASFDAAITNTGKLKNGTFKLTVEIASEEKISKEAYFETLWGNPITTKKMIDDIGKAGFNAVRLPVTWFCHMNENGRVDEAWMDRVEEVVNYILDNDMYCILNVHHDTAGISEYGAGWLKADTSDPSVPDRFAGLWEQIAERFKGYGDHLLFESFNEILLQDKQGNDIWGYPGGGALQAVNELNQLFVDTIRASGGNNSRRYLVVNTYGASVDQIILDGFVMPNDTIKDRLIAEVHAYNPHEFGWYNVTWATPRDTWGTPADKKNLDDIFDRLARKFSNRGIPVIIGEFGTCNKENTMERAEHAGYYVSAARKRGIICFWWDNGGNFKVKDDIYKEFGLYNRRKLTWAYPEIADAMVSATDGSKIQIGSLAIKDIPNHAYTGKALKPSVAVTDGSKKLTLGTDYTLNYSDNTAPGKATAVITGTGKYSGIATVAFNIVPRQTSIKGITGTKAIPCTIKWSGVTGADGYQVAYSTDKNGTYKSAGTTEKTVLDLKSLKKGTTYYFKVRAFKLIDKKPVYGMFSTIKSYKTK